MQPSKLKNVTAPLSEFRNMTFVELEDFVNMSCVTIKDSDTQFMNQAQEINKIFAQVGNNNRKCERINRKLNLLRHCQNMIELNVSVTNKNIVELEEHVARLECGEGINPDVEMNFKEMDVQRNNLYPIMLRMNTTMTTLSKNYEDIHSNLRIVEENDKRDQAKMAQKILDNQLRQLEHLEDMMHKMADNLQVIGNQVLKWDRRVYGKCRCV